MDVGRKKRLHASKRNNSRNASSTIDDAARSIELLSKDYKALYVADDELLDFYQSNVAFRKIIDSGEYVRMDGVFVLRPFAAYLKSHSIPIIDALSGVVDLSEQGFFDIVRNYCLYQFPGIRINVVGPCVPHKLPGNFRDGKAHGWGENEDHHPAWHFPRAAYRLRKRDRDNWRDTWSEKTGKSTSNTIHIHDGRVSQHLEPANYQGAHDSLAPSCLKEFLDSGGGNGDIPSLSELLTQHMSREKLTDEKMEELTGISERTIRGIRNDEDRRPLLRNVIAICIALKLNGDAARKMVRAAGYALRNTAEENAFSYLLQYGSLFSVLASNDFLKSMGYPPLTSLCSSEDESEK